MHPSEKIIILNFGPQYTQLIARKVRELGVYAEIQPYSISEEQLTADNPQGIILSGGPSSVYESGSLHTSFSVLNLKIPVLGICYGLQLIAYQGGGAVDRAARREFGKAELIIDSDADLFNGVSATTRVWMSILKK